VKLHVFLAFKYKHETLWMSQAQIASLFVKDQATISRHIGNIISEGELDESTSMQKVHKTMGRPVTLYNLDMIISIGYRVSSKQATLFRKWATHKLVQFATKGFVIDVNRQQKLQQKTASPLCCWTFLKPEWSKVN